MHLSGPIEHYPHTVSRLCRHPLWPHPFQHTLTRTPSCTSFPSHNHEPHTPSLNILFTCLTPLSGLVATRTEFMPETASSATHSLFLGFRLPDISLYPEFRASWTRRLHFPELRAHDLRSYVTFFSGYEQCISIPRSLARVRLWLRTQT